MGRTNPTYRDFLDEYERTFGDYRRALRRRYRDDFDRLFAGAREFADAAGYANHLDRDVLVLVSMLLAHEGRIAARDEEIGELRDDVSVLRDDVTRLRDDVDDLRKDVAGLREDVAALRERVDDAAGEGT